MSPYQVLGYIGEGDSAQPKTPCKGKSSRRKTLHGNQEKGCKEEKETLTVSETIHRIGPKEIPREASREKHLLRGFLNSVSNRKFSVVSELQGASGYHLISQQFWLGPG